MDRNRSASMIQKNYKNLKVWAIIPLMKKFKIKSASLIQNCCRGYIARKNVRMTVLKDRVERNNFQFNFWRYI